MNCFNNLVRTRFLRNSVKELRLAQSTIINDPMSDGKPSFFPGRLADRKKLYNFYLKLCDFKAALNDVDVDADDELVYYLQSDYIVWIASKYKYVIDKAVLETAYTTGEICLHQAKHIIQNRALYAAMFDTRISIIPLTTN